MLFIELCCGETSELCKLAHQTQACLGVRITIRHDVTNKRTMQMLLHCVTEYGFGRRVVVWMSFRCTGGSQMQHINEWKAHATSNHATLTKINDARWEFSNHFAAAQPLVRLVRRLGGHIALELPRGCSYWSEPLLTKLVSDYSLLTADFDGCMYGLIARYGDHAGLPMLKQWRLVTSCKEVASVITDRCNHDVQHVRIEGRNTKCSENYPSMLAGKVMLQFRLGTRTHTAMSCVNAGRLRSHFSARPDVSVPSLRRGHWDPQVYRRSRSSAAATAPATAATANMFPPMYAAAADAHTTAAAKQQQHELRVHPPTRPNNQHPTDARYDEMVKVFPQLCLKKGSDQYAGGPTNGHTYVTTTEPQVNADAADTDEKRKGTSRVTQVFAQRWRDPIVGSATHCHLAWQQRVFNILASTIELCLPVDDVHATLGVEMDISKAIDMLEVLDAQFTIPLGLRLHKNITWLCTSANDSVSPPVIQQTNTPTWHVLGDSILGGYPNSKNGQSTIPINDLKEIGGTPHNDVYGNLTVTLHKGIPLAVILAHVKSLVKDRREDVDCLSIIILWCGSELSVHLTPQDRREGRKTRKPTKTTFDVPKRSL